MVVQPALIVPGDRTSPSLQTADSASAFTAFPRDALELSIPARFEQQVRRFPDRLALKTSLDAVTYDGLNRRANRLARTIRARLGDGAEPVALLFEHGALVAGLLAALKAGKIYVPLDPTFPESRLALMLSDCQALVIVTNTRNLRMAQTLARRGCAVLDVAADLRLDGASQGGRPQPSHAPACRRELHQQHPDLPDDRPLSGPRGTPSAPC